MLGRIDKAITELEEALADLDVNCLVRDQPAVLLEQISGCENRLAAVRTRLARRAVETKAWRSKGHHKPEQWLASTTGTSVGQAKSTLEAGEQLESLPVVAEAYERGDVSEAQAKVIASAAAADPSSQSKLVETARNESLHSLKEEGGRIRAAAEPDEAARRARQHAARSLRTRTDPIDGMFKGDFALPPDQGAVFKARLDAELDRVFRRARNDGKREPLEAYAADALVNLALNHATGNNSESNSNRSNGSGRVRSEVLIAVDLAALRRGHTISGETCEIPGVGPVAVEVAREMLNDAFIKAVIHEGTDIRTVAHFGRNVPGELRTAIEFRDRKCAVPGCDRDARLEIDHAKLDYADGGPLALWNTDRLCDHHHHLKTHCGHELLGETGGPRTWIDGQRRVLSKHAGGPDPAEMQSDEPPPDTDPPQLQLE